MTHLNSRQVTILGSAVFVKHGTERNGIRNPENHVLYEGGVIFTHNTKQGLQGLNTVY